VIKIFTTDEEVIIRKMILEELKNCFEQKFRYNMTCKYRYTCENFMVRCHSCRHENEKKSYFKGQLKNLPDR